MVIAEMVVATIAIEPFEGWVPSEVVAVKVVEVQGKMAFIGLRMMEFVVMAVVRPLLENLVFIKVPESWQSEVVSREPAKLI